MVLFYWSGVCGDRHTENLIRAFSTVMPSVAAEDETRGEEWRTCDVCLSRHRTSRDMAQREAAALPPRSVSFPSFLQAFVFEYSASVQLIDIENHALLQTYSQGILQP
ncbi:hypothetical protein Mapa_004306 [Marchantia paleacea]|nr:hypothetical protein Mapa_004306 [Marchantia paleacea]